MPCNDAENSVRKLDDCGCCEPDLPEYPIYNRPGQPQIAFRLATHSRFQRRMLSRLPRWTVPDGDHAKQQSLSHLTTRDKDDPAIAFLDAWSTVADVLTFYQERIANEAWLRTATERRSVLELARTIGYELSPGVSASTWLAFNVDEGDSTPEETTVRTGTQVQSIPMKEDELPQIFETGDDFIAHMNWNRLLPRLTEKQVIHKNTRHLFFTGVDNNLKAGDRLLLIGTAKSADHKSKDWDMRRVLEVKTEAEKQRARVKVTKGLRELSGDFDILAMRQRASSFGHNAPDWNGLSKQVRADYLNLASVDELPAFDNGEWPRFSICAPGEIPDAFNTDTLPIQVTARQVADAAIEAASIQAEMLTQAAVASVPEVLISVGSGIATTATELSKVIKTQLKTVQDLFPNGDDGSDISGSPLYVIAHEIMGIVTDLLSSIGLQPPDIDWADLNESDNFFTAIVDIAKDINAAMDALVGDMNNVTSLKFSLPGNLDDRLLMISGELNKIRLANPLLLPVEILEEVQTAVSGAFQHAAASADAVASAGAASVLSQLLRSVIETEMLLDPTPEQVATVARFTTKIARYGALLHSPQTLFSEVSVNEIDLNDIPGTIDRLNNRLPAELRNLDDEDQLALGAVIGISALGAGGAAAVVGGTVGLPVAAAALGPGLLPLVLMGPSVHEGVAQINNAVELAIDQALGRTSEPVTSYRPVYVSDGCRVDLDARYDSIGPDSWAYLEAGGNKELFHVVQVSEESRAEYLLSGEVSRLTLDGPTLDPFKDKVRRTKVYAAGETLTLATKDILTPVAGLQVNLDKNLAPSPAKDAWLIVQGITTGGIQNTELVSIASAGATQLKFNRRLRARYQRDTVEMYLNVVPATHGETVADEVLGSGDGAQAFQRFKLRKPPLTHVSSAAPSGADSTLVVRVDGVEWRQVSSLYGLGPTDRVYIQRRSDAGDTYVQFGDGVSGARLPTGQENVSASYRSGIGFEGEVRAGSLILLKKRPFGIKDVNNPLPASGADEPEKLEDARQNAPLTVLTLDRIVSLQDFEDFARAYAGIGKASAVPLWHGEQELVHISVADASGDEIAETSTLFLNLRDAIERARDPLREVMLASFERRFFELHMRVLRNSAHRWEDVQSAIQSVLVEAFSFPNRDFGQPVTAAEIMELIHDVDGVEAVDIDKLYLVDAAGQQQGKDLSSVLPSASARAVNGGFEPAELLLIDAAGISLTEMSLQ